MKIGAQIGLWKRNLNAALKDISTAELEGIETFDLDVKGYYANPREFRSLLSKFKVTLSGVYFGVDYITPKIQRQELKKADTVIQFLRRVDCEFLILHSGNIKREGGYPVSAYDQLGDTMNKIGTIGREHGIKVACHPHVYTMVETRRELDLLMDRLDPDLVGLCPHASHFLYTGTDPYDIYRTYADRVNYVHVSDTVGINRMAEAYRLSKGFPKREIFKKMKIRSANLGAGEIDQRALMGSLLEAGFDGWVIIEGVDPESTPLEGIQVAANYLKREFMTDLPG